MKASRKGQIEMHAIGMMARKGTASSEAPDRGSQERTGAEKPSLLYLSPVVPATSGNGLAMRAGMVLQLLSRHYRVSLLVVPLYSAPGASVPPAIARLCARIVIVAPDRSPSETALWRRHPVLNAVGRTLRRRPRSYQSLVEAASGTFAGMTFDVVHVFRLAMLPFARSYLDLAGPTAERHLDLDDIESTAHRRLADLYRLTGQDHLASAEDAQAERSERLETEVLQRFDRLYVCSEVDRAHLRGRGRARICVLPNALPRPITLPPKSPGRPFTFLFVGTLGYYPNEDAVRFFCNEVLPLMRDGARRALRVLIVGTGARPSILQLDDLPDVKVVGAVRDVAPWYAQADAAIIPVRAGGGTRIKVLEAFRYECPVVSTTVGVEGIAASAEDHLLIGDTAVAMAHQCLRLMADPALGERLASNAVALFRRSYTFEAVARNLEDCS